MTPYTVAKAVHDSLDSDVTRLGAILRAFPGAGSGPMGLTPDSVRLNPDYRNAKRAFDLAFARLRAFNSSYVKTYAKELRDDRRKRLTPSPG